MPSKKKSGKSKKPLNFKIESVDESNSTPIEITKSTNNPKPNENCNNNQVIHECAREKTLSQ